MKMDYSELPSNWSRIVIDGDLGAGKSALAQGMSKDLSATVVSLDEYLLSNGDIYWDQIDYEPLRSKVSAIGQRIIIEGVCALKVLEKINVRHDYLIFIKRYNGLFGWEFGQYLSENARPPHDKLWQEIVQYYREYEPFGACNLVLYRDVCQPIVIN